MARHSRFPDSAPVVGASVFTDSGAMHKFAAPHISVEHARDAHQMGLSLQASAAELGLQQSEEYRRGRQVNQRRRLAWSLLAVAALLFALAAFLLTDAHVGDW